LIFLPENNKRNADDIWGEGKPFEYEGKKIDKEIPFPKKIIR
jgi:hypothetical protein